MSSGGNDPQISIDDLDRQIVELGHAIALNPSNAKTYRERGLLHGRKRDYGRAIADFERALSLSPTDARAYYLRGLALHRNGEPSRSIADFDKAIELDPQNAEIYRSCREKAEQDTRGRGPAVKVTAPNAAPARPKGLTGFFKRLAQYYAEFLS